MATPYALTPDGFELQWQTNFLAPFLFTRTLLPLLKSTAAALAATDHDHPSSRVRIVNVSSDAAFTSAPKELDLKNPNLEYLKGVMAPW